MKSSAIVLLCFCGGLLIGLFVRENQQWIENASMWLLYLLMFLVGISIGADPHLSKMLRNLSLRDLLYPIVTVVGTLTLTLLVAPLISRISILDSLAINSACGYYSLSSIIIPKLKSPDIGASAIAELGTIALMANVVRELIALTCAPYIVRNFGPRAAISAAGVTSVDVCLPAIRKWCGDSYVVPSILHGTIIDLSVPWMLAALTVSI